LIKDLDFLAEQFTGARRWMLMSELAIFSMMILCLSIWQAPELAFFAIPLRFASLFLPFSLAVVKCSLVTKLSVTTLVNAGCCRAFLCVQPTGSPEFIFVYMGAQYVMTCIALLIVHQRISKMPLAFLPQDLLGFIVAVGLSGIICVEFFGSFSPSDARSIAAYGSIFGLYGVSIIFAVLCCYLASVTKSGKIGSLVLLLISGSLFINEFWYTSGGGLMTLAYVIGSLVLLFPFLGLNISHDTGTPTDDLPHEGSDDISNAEDLNPYRTPNT